MTTSFSEPTRRLLRDAGWHPGRDVDITRFVQVLEHDGYTVFPVVQSFLREFGALHIRHRTFFRDQVFESVNVFDPLSASAGIYYERAEAYMEYLGAPLCVVGSISNYHATLLMCPAGRVYSTFDNLVHWGDSGEEAIENLCMRRRGRVVLEDDGMIL